MPIVGNVERQRCYIWGQISILGVLTSAWAVRLLADPLALVFCQRCHVADYRCCCGLAWRWLLGQGRIGASLEKFTDEQMKLDKRYKDIFPQISKGVYVLMQPRRFSNYVRITSRIGKGGYGTIFRAAPTDRGLRLVKAFEPGRKYAVKHVERKRGIGAAVNKSFMALSPERHVEFMRQLVLSRNDHIVRTVVTFIEMPDQLYTVMELLDGPDLMAWLVQRASTVPEVPVADITHQMLSAILYLHSVIGVIHRDVKPENFGFARPAPPNDVVDSMTVGSVGRGSKHLMPTIKLFDFGMVWILDRPVSEEACTDLVKVSPTGTVNYIAPECWGGLCGPLSDVWGVGLAAYMLFSGMLPFGLLACQSDSECRRALRINTLTFEADAWEYVSEPAICFLCGLLEKGPASRTTAHEALRSPWLQFPGRGTTQVRKEARSLPTSLKATLDGSWLSPETDGVVWRSSLMASGTLDTR